MFVSSSVMLGSRPSGRLSKRAVPSRTRAGREPKSVPKLKTSHSAFLGRKNRAVPSCLWVGRGREMGPVIQKCTRWSILGRFRCLIIAQ